MKRGGQSDSFKVTTRCHVPRVFKGTTPPKVSRVELSLKSPSSRKEMCKSENRIILSHLLQCNVYMYTHDCFADSKLPLMWFCPYLISFPYIFFSCLTDKRVDSYFVGFKEIMEVVVVGRFFLPKSALSAFKVTLNAHKDFNFIGDCNETIHSGKFVMPAVPT